MRGAMLAAATGIVAATRLGRLPDEALVVAALPLLLPLYLCAGRWTRIAAAFALGVAWGVLHGHRTLEQALPTSLEGRDLQLQVCIEGLPRERVEARGTVWRLRGRVLDARAVAGWRGRRIEFSWYGPGEFRPGELWSMRLRLRAPRGFVNPGGHDHQAWLHAEGIDGSGYARPLARRLGACHAGADPWRWALRERLEARLGQERELGKLLAVTLGDATRFSASDWELFARTGTTHLMVISGMHIALVAGLAYGAGGLLVRTVPLLLRRLPARAWGALLALPVTLAYAALAGWSVSVRRAALMCTAMLLCLLLGRAPPAVLGFCAALLAVLAMQPLVAMQAGFWLSFIAVAALLVAFGGRVVRPGRVAMLWRPQLAVGIALAVPLSLAGQAQAPFSPLVNALAIPLVDVLVVPAALAGCALLFLWEPPALAILGLALRGLEWLSQLLHLAASWSPPPITGAIDPDAWSLALAVTGAAWLLLPRGIPGRPLGVVLMLPLILPLRAPPVMLELLALDVGQGSAVIVRTARHALVYDTGPRYGERFDAGGGIVAPALRWLGSSRVDRLVLSHADADHAGGAPGLLRTLPVDGLLAGEPVAGIATEACRQGRSWRWDGVEFDVLHPAAGPVREGNEASCVLRIEAAGRRVLLAGDIGQQSERQLVAARPEALAADVLLVPHHGSRGSSHALFVEAVRPRYAIVSAGHRNPFGHPHPQVVARYTARGAELLDTPRDGAILLRIRGDGHIDPPLRWREHARRFWYREP